MSEEQQGSPCDQTEGGRANKQEMSLGKSACVYITSAHTGHCGHRETFGQKWNLIRLSFAQDPSGCCAQRDCVCQGC